MALAEDDDPTLPCGRTLSSVWSRAEEDEGAADDPHLAECPYCREALSRLGVLHRYVSETRQADEAESAGAHAERIAERFTARVMDLVRTELRPGRTLPLGEPDDDAWITEAAAAKAFRTAAERLPGVHAGSCRVTLTAPGGPVKVVMELAAGLTWPVPELAERVRRQIRSAAGDGVGMYVAEIDVRVVDLLDDTGDDKEEGPA
ncbi:Asp23/Gls24 family envelope stress response protein [Streptomyces pinistramenti]|uniref:Asp23/Gls24 family envelope stress response protein n=1 Tax=Streptomyces pinistramenti TaxID=2884812 RepID=UPI001D06A6F5|nr:Asp23/Gls24 family envelope stress response protein [Streptomyces pinistramenti]MCB5905949.1 Asp23/Gls24 family envelope stress response protein [Streptomyces pinistramenti]